MKLSPKIYIGAMVAITVLTAAIMHLWSNHKIASFERETENANKLAVEKQSAADEKERQAAEYKAKNEYLEQKLAEVQNAARKQDEELEKLSNNVDSARSRVERARRVRSVAATADELCAKLADLGHACQ